MIKREYTIDGVHKETYKLFFDEKEEYYKLLRVKELILKIFQKYIIHWSKMEF